MVSPGPLVAALAFALALWWAGTGAVLWLSRRPPAGRPWAMAAASLAAVVASAALVLTRDVATPAAAFAAFAAAVALWGWHELSFLTGVVTGPSTAACPPGARGWARFRAAAATLMHHELALALTAAAVAAMTLGAANPIGGLTFLVLFAARLSSKLNLFLGAPNFSAELFPERLRHLASYLRKAPPSVFYPVSLLGLALAVAAAAAAALAPEASPFAATGYALVATLLALAALEHLFMALPLPDAALWRWALPPSERPAHPDAP
jgi:putative photosynthetic complex assembly protein 2